MLLTCEHVYSNVCSVENWLTFHINRTQGKYVTTGVQNVNVIKNRSTFGLNHTQEKYADIMQHHVLRK